MFPDFPFFAFAPVPPLVIAGLALLTPGARPRLLPRFAEIAALCALALAATGIFQLLLNHTVRLSTASGPLQLILHFDTLSGAVQRQPDGTPMWLYLLCRPQ